MDENGHLHQFNEQSSILTTEGNYRRFFRGQDNIGRPPDANDPQGSMFVSTSADIDRALKESNGNSDKLAAYLGVENYYGDSPVVRIDINHPEEFGLRVSNGKEAGANAYWNTPLDENGKLPNIQYTQDNSGRWCVDTEKTGPKELAKLNGQYWDQNGQYHAPNPEGYNGKTSGGLLEAVINQVPNTPQNVSYTKIDGFHRGEDSELSSSKITSGYGRQHDLDKDILIPPNPKQDGMPAPVGAKKEDLPEIQSPKIAEPSAVGPQNPSQIPPSETSTILQNLSSNKDPNINTENEAVSAAKKATGGMNSG